MPLDRGGSRGYIRTTTHREGVTHRELHLRLAPKQRDPSMANERNERIDIVRRRLSDRENQIVDEYQSGMISRRDFIRGVTVAGLSIPLAGFLAGPVDAATKATKKAAAGARKPLLRVSVIAPGSALDPVIANNGGALLVLGLAGEYLSFDNKDGVLEPRVAESWTPNADSTVWTFKIRKGLKFHNGKRSEEHTSELQSRLNISYAVFCL